MPIQPLLQLNSDPSSPTYLQLAEGHEKLYALDRVSLVEVFQVQIRT